MTHTSTELPRAWLGDAKAPNCVRVCAWCPDTDEAERLAQLRGLAVTHALCTICYNKQISSLLGEREDENE